MTFRSKVCLISFSLIVAFSGLIHADSFRFAKQIKSKYIEKVLKDYPMLATKDISVTIQSEPFLEGVVSGAESFAFSLAEKSDVIGRTLVPISFMDGQGAVVQKVNMVVDVEAKAQFIRVKTMMKKNMVLSRDNTEEVELSMKGYNKSHLLVRQTYLGKQSLSTLVEGTVLATWMFDDIPLIRNGETVRVFIQKPGYELEVKGIAMDNGKKSEKIRVQLDVHSRKILQCEVVNETTVRYQGLY